ncbi:MAG: fibronectin type III domain-containing protein, partial [Fluviicola sp.]
MLKIYKLLLLAVFSIPLIGFSQVSLYGFNQTTTTYTPITGGTVYGNTTTDDQRFVDPAVPLGGTVTTGVGIPIGFNFTYNGQVYDRIAINNNGWISFGSSLLTPSVNNASSSSYTAISATSTATPAHLRNRVGGFARDLQGQVGSELRIETIGTAPNRVCVIQWTNYRRFGATGDIINFQIRLNETTNYVESVYGTCSTTNTGATITAQVGLSGSVNSDFNNRQGTWSATTAGTINTSNLTFITTNIPVNNSRFLWGPAPAAPAAPTQDPGIPTCSAGTNINAVGAPTNPDETYYWQTTASGTSTTQPASTPLTVFANGTYFIRSYNSVLNVWSTANSITVTNFPVAAAPPAPTALANPACTPGTTISVPAPPLGLEYYWQGTVLNGSSQADLADSPFNVTNSGTYYVAAFDIASQCWSPTTSIVMTVDSQIPNNPIVAVDYLNLCAGATTGLISATTSSNNPGTLATTQAGGNGCNNGNMFNLTSAASPITITSLDITPNTTGAQTVAVYYKTGTYIGSEANLAAWTLVGNYPITGTIGTPINIDIADVNIPASSLYGFYVNFNAQYTNIAVGVTYSNADLTLTVGAGFCTAFSGPIAGRAFNGTIHYTKPVNGTATWFDAPTGGTVIGTGSPFETVGSSEMPIAVDGVYEFYVASTLGGCFSPNRELVTVNVNQIVVELGPIDVTCNGLAEGSFSLDSTVCGTGPFNYSVNGGAFGPIPTNLTAGTYSIVAQDASLATSSPVVVTISEPTAPQTLSASNITYFNATLSWTAQGSETSWVVEYGPAGFTPGTGTIVNATNDSIPISGLTEDTDYEFYVAAGCTPTSDVAGPFAFSTDVPFYTFDNQCGPGWTDISSTGTPAGFVSLDDDVVDVTLPWPWNVNGQTVTDIGIGTNGHVAFGTGAFVTYNPTVNGLYICNADLQSIDANGAYYQSIGTAPNRQFIIQWVGMQDWPAAGAGSPSASFEIIVDEASGEVYYIYDNAPATMPAYTAMAGIDIAVYTSNGNAIVQTTGTTNIQNNSCYHFYNAMCPNVQNFSGIIFSDDALLDWNPGAYNESTWTLVYGLEGFDPTIPGQEIGTFNLVSSDANFGGSLTQLTTY